jgi:4'-phosphopantetheinyl transferase
VASGTINNTFLHNIQWQNAVPAAFAIRKNEVHVWRISVSENLHRADALLPLLNLAEVERAGRYFFKKDRDLFIISRAAQRMILGRYLDMLPALLHFALGANNKPYIGSSNPLQLHYNLSHSNNYALLAVSTEIVGCDVEYINAAFKYSDILHEHFSADEADYIKQQNSAEPFFTLWTRKEALLKGTGQGIRWPAPCTPRHSRQPIQLGGKQLFCNRRLYWYSSYALSCAAITFLGNWSNVTQFICLS